MEIKLDGIVRISNHPETGASYTKTKSGNDNYSYMVHSSEIEFTVSANKLTSQTIKHRVAFVTIIGLSLAETMLASGMLNDGRELPGKIVMCEQLIPFGSDEDYNLKMNPKTGEIMYHGKYPIYWKYVYDPTGTMKDENVLQWIERTGFIVEA